MIGDQVTRAVLAAASIGELSWVTPTGLPRVAAVVPLVLDDSPAIAFTYADHDLAVEVAHADRITVSVTEPRSTGAGFRPMRVSGRPRLIRDFAGDLFVDRLLDQELRRYPPSRLLADSTLLRREHWWYLPRLIVTVTVDDVADLPERRPPSASNDGDQLLVVADGGATAVEPVSVPEPLDQVGAAVSLIPAGSAGPASGPAVLFGQDASFPDLERWSRWSFHGTWDAASNRFSVIERPSSVGLEAVPSLLARWRRQRALERRCRKALARASETDPG